MAYDTYTIAESITPGNTAEANYKGLYIGSGGTVCVDLFTGATGVKFCKVPDGTLLPLRVTKVWETNTNAAAIVGLS